MPGSSARVRRAIARLPGAVPLYELSQRPRLIRDERRLHDRDGRIIAGLLSQAELRLNMGASAQTLPGWVNFDLRPSEAAVQLDAAKPWPFRDASAEAVNSEHMIEHLTEDQVEVYLSEAFRVLRPGGVIRTSTPDLRAIAEAYLAGEPHILEVHRSHSYAAATHGDMLNNYAYMFGHCHLWDYEGLKVRLERAGFEQIVQTAYGQSAHPALAGIDRHDMGALRHFALCVDAVRP